MKHTILLKTGAICALLSGVSCVGSYGPRTTGYMAGIGGNPNNLPSNGRHHYQPRDPR